MFYRHRFYISLKKRILNKDVILVLLEQELYYSHLNVEFYNVFYIYREKFNPYGRRTFLFSQDANRWGEDVLKLQKKGPIFYLRIFSLSLLFFYVYEVF